MKKKVLSAVLTGIMLVSLTACGGFTKEEPQTSEPDTKTAGGITPSVDLPSFKGQELKISTFSFNTELLQKNVYDPFMEATGCKLVVEGGKNAERVTKIKETPKNYDVVVISDAFMADLIEGDFIEPIDPAELSNLDSLYDIAKAPLGNEYGPAYTFNRLGIVYDKTFCPVEIHSWADLWNPELKGSIAIPDITTTSGPIFYYCVAKMAGLTPGTDDDAIFKKMEELKPNIMKTYTSANDTITMLNQGEISAAVLLDFSYTAAKSASEDYVWVDPAEGTYGSFNAANMVKGCENKELATAFIDFYISKEVQTAEALDGVDSPVRTDVELTPEQSVNYTYGKEMISRLQLPDWSVINGKKADWTARWNELFSVR
ncbi:extracellular solute-binding protein [Clostridium sp. MCC353]|uniref:ABC transporter substrate-binding protein n=1 Tax=Clostridium sp. MCC353 TaxID=2592646 RepID=UPI001C01E8FE|nr:ABC transporter substrate-binding protein [Clostridium sp. MCC353]MBT9776627.1 extracellular solute-binding protein [Clostridium sp. MCC353]